MFRWFAFAILFACLSISIYYRRRARKEGETIPRLREDPPFIVARLMLGLPIWLATLTYVMNPRWMEWASFAPPEWLRWAGVSLGFLTVPAAYWVFRSLGRNVSETVLTKEHHELVTHGPYRWIRHPLYSMAVTLFLAIGLMAANWLILLFAFIVLVFIRMAVVPLEEKALLATFGDQYRDYMRYAGRMFPRLSGRR